jgi:hypothetical protein
MTCLSARGLSLCRFRPSSRECGQVARVHLELHQKTGKLTVTVTLWARPWGLQTRAHTLAFTLADHHISGKIKGPNLPNLQTKCKKTATTSTKRDTGRRKRRRFLLRKLQTSPPTSTTSSCRSQWYLRVQWNLALRETPRRRGCEALTPPLDSVSAGRCGAGATSPQWPNTAP